MVVTSILSLVLRFVLSCENKRRDALQGESNEAINVVEQRQEELDLTDGENKAFRYSLYSKIQPVKQLSESPLLVLVARPTRFGAMRAILVQAQSL